MHILLISIFSKVALHTFGMIPLCLSSTKLSYSGSVDTMALTSVMGIHKLVMKLGFGYVLTVILMTLDFTTFSHQVDSQIISPMPVHSSVNFLTVDFTGIF